MPIVERRTLAGPAGAALLLLAILAILAPNVAEAAGHSPYRLMIRYGSVPTAGADDTQPSAAFLRKARRIDIDVSAMDDGRVATRDAVLSYSIDASHGSDASLDIALTYARAGGQSSVDTHILLPRNRWLHLSGERGEAGSANTVYVRLQPN